MTGWKLKWKKALGAGETNSNILVDRNESIIFYYNYYADDLLKERKTGRLISISPEGEENWEFSFPVYNYLYFSHKIAMEKDRLYTVVESNRSHDSGYERGLYSFDLDGLHLWHYKIAGIADSPTVDESGCVYVFDNNKEIYALTRNGKLIEKAKSITVKDGNAIKELGEPIPDPILYDLLESKKNLRLISFCRNGNTAYCLVTDSDKGGSEIFVMCFES